jgi:hypothetical protein
MRIREHADATPDKPAVIIHPTGTVVTFRQLEVTALRGVCALTFSSICVRRVRNAK